MSLEEVSLKFKRDGVRHYVVTDDDGNQQASFLRQMLLKKIMLSFFWH